MRYFKDNSDGTYALDDGCLSDASWIEISQQEWQVLNPTIQTKTFIPLSAWQVRKVLTQFGLRAQVEQAVSQASQEVKDAWAYANEFNRDSSTLIGMAQVLNITDAQLDQMFTIGATL